MGPQLANILAELRTGLEFLYGDRLAEIVLFGSQARGDQTTESDIDILVVLRDETVDAAEEIERSGALVSRLSLEHDMVLSCSARGLPGVVLL